MRAMLLIVLVVTIATPVVAGDVTRGERLYGQWCQGCHDRLGPNRETMPGTTPLATRYQGTVPAALVDRTDLTPEFIKVIVRQGISFMPTFRKTELSDAELDDIVAFLVRKQPTAQACQQLAAQVPSDTTISSLDLIPPGELPAFCRLTGTTRTSASSSIRVEVWLPAEGWNGKFLARGYSFYGGPMDRAVLAEALKLGYATATTDAGGNGERGASFLLRQPEKVIDVGERAWHSTVVLAKTLATAYYGSAPRTSYFSGCGGAGRQGLKAAQRYPEDFDGIAVGGIAHDTAHFAFAQMWVWDVAHRSPAHRLPAEKLAVLNRAAIRTCELSADPRDCKFDPAVVQCQTAEAADCLTAAQVETARAIYSPVINPRTKQRIFGPLMPGSELGWASAVEAERPSSYALDFFKYLVFEDPAWDHIARPLDYDRDVERATSVASSLSAVDPDLSRFVKRGGKLLMFGGWNDTAIPPTANTDYYESVQRRMGSKAIRDSVRLFMVPGMGHCPGAQFDPVAVLVDWHEHGKPPAQISVGGTLVCPYPSDDRDHC